MRLTIVDDSRLVELAAPRAVELFPVLRRASAASPLLAVLAFLPALFALEHTQLSENDAQWGLRSFELLSARDLAEVVDPSASDLTAGLRWQPPLGTWLTAAIMRAIGPTRTFGLYVVSFAATVGLIGCVYALCRTMAAARLTFWVVLLCAGNAALLSMVQEAAPHALALLFAVGAFWGYLAHLKSATGMVSLKLLGGGISLGLCLLSGGPLAMIVVAVLLLFVLGFRGESLTPMRGKGAQRTRVWIGWPALRSLLVLCLTGFAVGGWWVLMMASNYGTEFWNGWIGVTHFGAQEGWSERVAADLPAAERFIATTGVLCGLSLAGLFYACFLAYTSDDEEERLSAHFLISWTACGVVVWLSLLRNEAVPAHVVALWERFLTIPLIIAGAVTVDRVDRRKVGFWLAAGLIVLSLVIVFVDFLAVPGGTEVRGAAAEIAGWWIAFSIALGIAAWWAFRYRRNRYIVQQVILAGLVVSVVAINACLGLASVAAGWPDNQPLEALRDALALRSNSTRCTLIAADEPPLRLRYVLETTLPRARLTHVKHWDAALSQALSETGDGTDATVVVDWSARDTRPATIPIPGVGVAPIASVQSFEGRQLRTYLMTARPR